MNIKKNKKKIKQHSNCNCNNQKKRTNKQTIVKKIKQIRVKKKFGEKEKEKIHNL